MKIVTVGRSSSNDIRIDNAFVSRVHCQIIQDDNGNFRLIDTNSTNGTFVNGYLCRGEVRLNKSDVVKIGNITLPWQNYFTQPAIDKQDIATSAAYVFTPGHSNTPQYIVPDSTAQQSGLGTVALVLSIIGAVLLIYCAIRIMKWGIFALIGNASTFIQVSVAMNILAFILASIADYKNYKDSDAAYIAECISVFCIVIVIGFILYLKYGGTNLLNPFRNIF